MSKHRFFRGRDWRLTGLLSLTALGALAAATAQAAAPADGPQWTFGGFGTLGVSHASERYADYSANVVNPGTAGYTSRWSEAVDSKLGAQLGLVLNAQWSAVLQVVTERKLQNAYRPAVEWANIKYQVTADVSLRVGRIAMPMYLVGDYRKAGYALQWTRPPVEVYGGLPVTNSDGIDASYRWHAGSTNHLSQAFFGSTEVKVSSTGRAKARQLTGLSNTTTYNGLTVRASALTAELSVDLARPLFDAFRQFGPQGEQIANQYDIDHKRVVLTDIGVSYDNGDWFAIGEVGRLDTRAFLGDKTSMFVTTGYRFGDWAPYVTYAKVRSNDAIHTDGLALTGLPPQVAVPAAYLNGQLNGLLSQNPIQHTVSAGVRWDFMPDRALKLQYDRLRPTGGSSGTLVNPQPGFQSGHPVQVFSAVLDFVY